MLWKTSWLGQEPAENKPCLGPAMEPIPAGGPADPTSGGRELRTHFQIFFWGWKSGVGLCLSFSVSLGLELERKWGRFGHVNVPELTWLLPY